MKKFLVSGMYTDGASKGRVFLLGKGGYVVDMDDGIKPLPMDCYDTERAAKMVASKYNKRNEWDVKHNHYITPCRYTVSEINY